MSESSSKYFVLNGHTLCYFIRGGWLYGTLASKPQLGGNPDPLNATVAVGPSDDLRPATHADFEFFRVSPRGHLPEVEAK